MPNKDIYILAIESSCDDTSAAVLHNNKVLSNVKDIGNTVSSTIPIMIIDDLKKKKIKKNKNIMIIGFGVGYSLSGGIFKFV